MSRKTEISAGILLYRGRADHVEVLLAHPGGPYWAKKDDGVWTIPKGLVDPGEDLLTAARREFREETGFVAEGPFIALGAVQQKSGKTVHGFACAGDADPQRLVSNSFEIEWPPRSRKRARFPEIDRVAWLDPLQAERKILPYQLQFLREFQKVLTTP